MFEMLFIFLSVLEVMCSLEISQHRRQKYIPLSMCVCIYIYIKDFTPNTFREGNKKNKSKGFHKINDS